MVLNKQNIKRIIFILFAAISFAVALIYISDVWAAAKSIVAIFSPIILGLCLAFLLDPLTSFFETKVFGVLKRKFPKGGGGAARGLGLFVSLLIVAAVIAAVVLLIIPEMRTAFAIIGETIPDAVSTAITNINNLLEKMDVEFRIPTGGSSNWMNLLSTAKQYLSSAMESGVIGNIATTAMSVVSGMINFLMGLILSIYVLLQRDRICAFTRRFIKAYCKKSVSDKIFSFSRLSATSFRNFVTGQLTEAVIIAVLCFVGMIVFRFPYPTAASAIIGVSALIPVFGAWIGGSLGALLALSVSPLKALLFIVFIVVLQQLEGNLIYPKVVGKSIGLPGILVFVAVTLGASIGGVVGMVLGVPLCAILYTLISTAVQKRLVKKGLEQDGGGETAPVAPQE